MEQGKLTEILELHANWRYGEKNGVRANLRGANLQDADLQDANLRDANLQDANLQDANLRGANLRDANLQDANLRDANLRGANLQGADLWGANLRGANLQGADFDPIPKLTEWHIVPQIGAFIGFKKLANGTIATLSIPADAYRTSSPVGRKCRAEFIDVLEGNGKSSYDSSVVYEPGKRIYPDKYDGDWRVECSNGIHFYISHKEAENN